MEQFTITVIIHNKVFRATSNGTKESTVFEGDERLLSKAREMADLGVRVRLGDSGRAPVVAAGYDSPLALTAALFSISPQYAHVYSGPSEVANTLKWARSDRRGLRVEGVGEI